MVNRRWYERHTAALSKLLDTTPPTLPEPTRQDRIDAAQWRHQLKLEDRG